MKRVYRDKKASIQWSAARNEEASRPADKPLVKRGFCYSIGLYRISLVRASEESFRSDAFGACPVLPDPAPPPPCRALGRPDPPVVCPGFEFNRSSRSKIEDRRLGLRAISLCLYTYSVAWRIAHYTRWEVLRSSGPENRR